METKLNIAEILKDKPENTKLYSPLFGNVYFSHVQNSVINVQHHGGMTKFFNNGRYYNYPESELLLFPSKEMRDWEKFAWKKGDVLINDAGYKILFDKWENDDYTRFFGSVKVHCYDTEDYALASKEKALEFFKSIEKIQGGKLNLETLEIEKQLEFKDGDIIVTDAVSSLNYSKCIFILKGDLNTNEYHANSYVFYNINNNHISFNITDRRIRDRNIHLATDSEKQQLFSVLAKEGKAWDAEKKEIVGLKPKVDELKPFDKVLVRDNKLDYWRANLFSNINNDGCYRCVLATWTYCIPYEGNEYLLGTTKDVEG